MPTVYHNGDRMRTPTGAILTYDATGNRWVETTPAPPRTTASRTAPGGIPAGVQGADAREVNRATTEAAAAADVGRNLQNARDLVTRLHTGPIRGTILETGVPRPQMEAARSGGSSGNSLLDRLGQIVVGGIGGLTGYITPDNVTDLQTLRRYRSQNVLQGQREQVGPQTDTDAARQALGTIDPTQTEEANLRTIAAGQARARRAALHAARMALWIRDYGSLSRPNHQGQGFEENFQQFIASRPELNPSGDATALPPAPGDRHPPTLPGWRVVR